MSDQEYVKSLIKEAEVYRKQGLLEQAKSIYFKVLEFIKKSQSLSGRKDLISAVGKKIEGIDGGLVEVQEAPDVPELNENQQNMIKDLFGFSQDKNAASMEGAMALAKFGQYESALAEFNTLLKEGIMPLIAAKNIVRCHLALSSPNEAIDQYERWMANETLVTEHMEKLRVFLSNILEKKGVLVNLPTAQDTPPESDAPAREESKSDGDVLDISSVGVRLTNGPEKGRMVEFEVTFQSGNIISIVLSSSDNTLVKTFNTGHELPDMQFYSPIAIFRGKGIVSGKTKIKSGPKKGDFMLDIRVESG